MSPICSKLLCFSFFQDAFARADSTGVKVLEGLKGAQRVNFVWDLPSPIPGFLNRRSFIQYASSNCVTFHRQTDRTVFASHLSHALSFSLLTSFQTRRSPGVPLDVL